MTPEHEELIYQGIRHMVTWDEPRADVFHRLEVNGITGVQAEAMYAKARSERIQTIRADSARKAAWGLLLLGIGVGVFIGCWIGMGGITRLILILCSLAVGFGTWRFFKGIFGFIFASSKEGSLADDE